MSQLLEIAAARATLSLVNGLAALWRPCDRCGYPRHRWHRHPARPLATVLELHRTVGRGGDAA